MRNLTIGEVVLASPVIPATEEGRSGIRVLQTVASGRRRAIVMGCLQ